MIKKIDHIGIVIPDIEQGKVLFSNALGLNLEKEEVNHSWNVIIAFFRCGEVLIELLQPFGPGSIQSFLETHGSGIHHICYEVDDIEKAMEYYSKHFILESETPLPGADGSKVFFIAGESLCNVETELVQLKPHN